MNPIFFAALIIIFLFGIFIFLIYFLTLLLGSLNTSSTFPKVSLILNIFLYFISLNLIFVLFLLFPPYKGFVNILPGSETFKTGLILLGSTRCCYTTIVIFISCHFDITLFTPIFTPTIFN